MNSGAQMEMIAENQDDKMNTFGNKPYSAA